MEVKDIIKEIETLNEEERMKVIAYLNNKYQKSKAIPLGKSYDWWNNEEDDIYNDY